jgi:thiamine-phosphate diphosphorylase
MSLPRLHLVTDDDVLAQPSFAATAEAVLARCGPEAALHLRGHGTTAAARFALGERLAAAALRTGAWLLVNDRVDIAMAVRANGVQLGVRSLPVRDARALLGAGARIGFSVHSALEALDAVSDGADFVVMGTIYASLSHPGELPVGPASLQECARRAGVPVIAIGGISAERVAEVTAAGAHGIAVLSAVWHAPDPPRAAEGLVAALRAAHPGGMEQEQVV